MSGLRRYVQSSSPETARPVRLGAISFTTLLVVSLLLLVFLLFVVASGACHCLCWSLPSLLLVAIARAIA